jgi:hypothetical protein
LTDPFSARNLKVALDAIANRDLAALGKSPLARLDMVEARLHAERLHDTPMSRGKALDLIFRDALEQLAPGDLDDDELQLRPYRIVKARMEGKSPVVAAQEVGLSVDRWWAVQRERAIPALASVLWEMQEAAQAAQRHRHLTRHVPAATYDVLFGVEDRLAELRRALQPDANRYIISIDGLGGMGKTAAAHAVTTWAAEQRTLFHDIVWETAAQEALTWQGIERRERPALTFEKLLDAIAMQLGYREIPRMREREKIASLRAMLKERPYLIVVDNLETAEDYQTLVARLVEFTHPSKFLLTSRFHVGDDGHVYRIHADQLGEDAALALIRHEAQARSLAEVASAPDERLVEIVRTVGGNPLAIKLVVGQLTKLPLSQILDYSTGIHADQLYLYLYRHSWQLLSEAAQRLLVLMPLLPTSGGAWDDLLALTGYRETALAAAVGELVNKSLLNVGGFPAESPTWGEKIYSIHRLTHHFVMSELVRVPEGLSGP